MFEVMTLVTCDGPPGGGGWVAGDQPPAQRKEMGPRVAGLGAADDAGSEAAVAVVLHHDSAGLCHQEPRGLTPAQPGVHSADINDPAAKAPSGNR